VPFVSRLNSGTTKGFQAKMHAWNGECQREVCPCHETATKFFADEKYGGRWFAQQLAWQWCRDQEKKTKLMLKVAKVAARREGPIVSRNQAV
jgi:hypothetical protein